MDFSKRKCNCNSRIKAGGGGAKHNYAAYSSRCGRTWSSTRPVCTYRAELETEKNWCDWIVVLLDRNWEICKFKLTFSCDKLAKSARGSSFRTEFLSVKYSWSMGQSMNQSTKPRLSWASPSPSSDFRFWCQNIPLNVLNTVKIVSGRKSQNSQSRDGFCFRSINQSTESVHLCIR